MAGRYCQDLGRGATKARPEHPVGSGLLADHYNSGKGFGWHCRLFTEDPAQWKLGLEKSQIGVINSCVLYFFMV